MKSINKNNFTEKRKNVFWFHSNYSKHLGYKIYFVITLSLISVILGGFGITLVIPLLGHMQNSAIQNSNLEFFNKFLQIFSINGINQMIFFMSLIFIAKGGFNFFEGFYSSRLQANLLQNLKGGMFSNLMRMDYNYYVTRNTGHFVNVLNEQITLFTSSFGSYVKLVTNIITAAVYLIFAFYISWKSLLIGFIAGSIMLLFFQYFNKYLRQISRKQTKQTSELNKNLIQILHGFKYIISTSQYNHIKGSVKTSIRLLSDYFRKTKIIVSFIESIREPIVIIILLVIVGFHFNYYGSGIEEITVTLLLLYRSINYMTASHGQWQKVISKVGAIEVVNDELENLTMAKELDGKDKINSFSKEIRLKNIYYSFNKSSKEENVLCDINLTISANTTIGIIGESGAGKSTLVDLLTILLKPTKGELLIDGQSTSDLKLESWRNQIGYVCQDSVMFDDTIANNIGMWSGNYRLDKEYRNNVHQIAKSARADIFINELKNGYETVIGDRGIRLSGGQCQRLFIARELYKKPKLLILDEATSALDTESEKHIQESIDFLKGKMTVVIVAHRLSTIKNADQIYVLDKGRIIESGSFNELQQSENSRFRKMIEIQSL
ncbi:MAG: ABC transporter ATP-binding protein [Candidatus Marinimicrobia bacterium]|nr:ABC transporter ATP-binding protein [Candidatus Neomarinimicrobiota bacterium]